MKIEVTEFVFNGKTFTASQVETALTAFVASQAEQFDFGNGPVPAHRHLNGGGWVANTATVADSAFVGPFAQVYGDAKVYDNAEVYGAIKEKTKKILPNPSLINPSDLYFEFSLQV